MRKFIYITLLSLSPLFACSGEFVSCSQKVFDAKVVKSTILIIPINNSHNLLYTDQSLPQNAVAYNAFLGLALVRTTNPFKYPYTFSITKAETLAAVTATTVTKVHYQQHTLGLTSLGKLNIKIPSLALLSDGCCHLEGLVTPQGVIEKAYLEHFINTQDSFFADLGIRVVDQDDKIVVIAVDPFYKQSPFKVGDVIVSYKSQKFTAASSLMQAILFSTVGSKPQISFKRRKQEIKAHLPLQKRYGGGLLSDTFLESKGLYFNKSLHLVTVATEAEHLYLQPQDKLISVNNKTVSSFKAVQIALHSNHNKLLFERKGFQFTVILK